MDFGNWQRSVNESVKSDKYTVLDERDEKGRLIVEGDMNEFLKDLDCVPLEVANRRFFDLIGNKD